MSMKISLFALCFLCATAALGQSGMVGSALSNQASVFEFSSHEEFAAQKPMGIEHNLLEGSTYSWAQGERPLWEVAPVTHRTPLGDSARLLKKEHESAKKADFIWNN